MMNAVLALAVMMGPSFYDFKMPDIDGKPVEFSKFKGKTVLVVNVASKCGLTPQYQELEALYQKYKARGFVLLGFPANEFGGQEPGTNEQIKQFCSATYGVSFPMFSKIVVKGQGIHPLYSWLLEKGPSKDDIEWNFAKFLIGKDGSIKQRFSPRVKPSATELIQAIEKDLG